MKKYSIRDYECGNTIVSDLTFEEAKELLKQYEETDKRDGTYTPNFYEIKEMDIADAMHKELKSRGVSADWIKNHLIIGKI